MPREILHGDAADVLDEPVAHAHGHGMEARVAVLEEIAATTRSLLKDVRDDLRAIRDNQETEFRVLIYMGAGAVLAVVGVMATGFHWL